MPKVHMECISRITPQSIDYQDVRICIAKFKSVDYTANYSELIREYKDGQRDISHLVALHIVDSTSQTFVPRFYIDPANNFDVIIETGLKDLKGILMSIMLDISLYHYFSLSDKLPDRKKFNGVKHKHLTSQLDKAKEIYGNISIGNQQMYLPFSYKAFRDKQFDASGVDLTANILRLQKEYCLFLGTELGTPITFNSRGSIINPKQVQDVLQDTYPRTEKLVRENSNLKRYILVLYISADNIKREHIVRFGNDGLPEEPWGARLRDIRNLQHICNVQLIKEAEH